MAPDAGREPRFIPGTLLLGRYRVVALVGRGGFGEVYRAEDLKLGQAVALKFLPREVENDRARLRRLLDEVRLARQVSHPNVCRVFDVGEVDGQHFLSMEFVDGEDLGSLLRRIGHIPKAKAIELARQLCAGLAAAHETGVVHRDLKPGNVMIDGRGRARIADFGLAAGKDDVAEQDPLAGTPGYMAPEQLAGGDATVRSDLYGLGLVLYELFTGKPAFRARDLAELRRLQTESTPAAPSSFMDGFDPAVERVLLRCLDPDPTRRPSSALAVAGALPGGDPLAAALAAGETPSPEMVAEARGEGAARPGLLWAALMVVAAAFAILLFLAPRATLLGLVRMEKPPQFLQERAREILAASGSLEKPADSLFTFSANRPYLEGLLRGTESGGERWETLRSPPPSGILFWYRQSPSELQRFQPSLLGRWLEDPPSTVPGMAQVALDPDGRLVSLSVVPPPQLPGSAGVLDFLPLLRETGVDLATLRPAAPEWTPPSFSETRVAWTGVWPQRPDLRLRIEAAAAGGRATWLQVFDPWARPEMPARTPVSWYRVGRNVDAFIFVFVTVVAGIAALRNVRRGRGDRRGALRFALYFGALRMLCFLGAHHVAGAGESDVFTAHLAYAMLRVGLGYVFYLAIEPYARRLWPRMLVSWVRVLEGRFRDPLVGRDLLLGCSAGAVWAVLRRLQGFLPQALGGAPVLPSAGIFTLESLRGPFPALVSVIGIHTQELLGITIPLTLLLILRLALRSTIAAMVVVSGVGVIVFFPESGSVAGHLIAIALASVLFWTVLFRAGFLPLAVMGTVTSLLTQLPLTPRPASWYAGQVALSVAVVAIPTLYGFWIARANRPLFGDMVLEPRN